MDVITYTAARNRLAQLLEKVTADGAPVLITRQRGKPAVLISLEEYAVLDETAICCAAPKMPRASKTRCANWMRAKVCVTRCVSEAIETCLIVQGLGGLQALGCLKPPRSRQNQRAD